MAGAELVTLFGDDLSEVRQARIGIRVAGDTKVHARDLANMLLALSVVDLVDQGLATLAHEEVAGRLRTRNALVVRSTGDGEGFSGLLSQRARNGIEVQHLAYRLLGTAESAGAEMKLLGTAQSFLAPSGAVRAAAKQGLFARMGAATPYEVDNEAVGQHRAAWEELRQRWERFKVADPGRGAELIEQCSKSIAECKAGD